MSILIAINTPLRLACAAFVVLLVPAARAATIVWANNGGTWATGANWVGGTAPANSTTTDIASFTSGTAVICGFGSAPLLG